MPSRNVLYYGKETPLPDSIPLTAGPLTMVYEAGDLRYIKLGSHELLRRVYAAVRDEQWGTVQPELSNVHMAIEADSFRITYDAEYYSERNPRSSLRGLASGLPTNKSSIVSKNPRSVRLSEVEGLLRGSLQNRQGGLDFLFQAVLTGDATGITFTLNGRARSAFLRNRIGFCVLHPMACAGKPVKIEHVDGSTEVSAFSRLIAPQLVKDGRPCPVTPFDNLRALAYEVGPDLWAEVRFTGEVFEMEDQRNWTDASFKTYCTPLSLPFPVEIKAGTEITQTVTLSLVGSVPEVEAKPETPAINLALGTGSAKPLPSIGLGSASHGEPLTPQEIARLKALNLSHLRLDLDLASATWVSRLGQACEEARALGVSLEMALFVTDDAEAELEALSRVIQELQPPVLHWLIFHRNEATTSARWVDLARRFLARYAPAIPIGAGTDSFFTQINAEHPPVEVLDVVAYSLNPQAHAIDNRSLVENLEAQAATVTSARKIAGEKAIAISPVTLKPRSGIGETGVLPPQVDVRQLSLFGAGWTVGSLKYLLESNVQSATYYETTGWRGVMEVEAGAPLPELFPSTPGAVFPLYHVLADIGEFVGGEIIPCVSSETLVVDGLVLSKGDRTRVLIANLTGQVQRVTLANAGTSARVRSIDETTFRDATQFPEAFRMQPVAAVSCVEGLLTLKLLPYAVARVDF